MILKSLEDLEKYKDSIKPSNYSVSIKEINKVSEVGGESTNSSNNKLFYWNFETYHIEALVKCYEKILKFTVNSNTLAQLEIDIMLIAKEMMDEDTCPIEAILYASKIVNNLIIKNNLIVEVLGNIIAQIYYKNKYEYKDTIEFILKEWSWNNQIMILINACGKIGDLDLLKLIYKYHTQSDNKLQALKSFMNVRNSVCIDYSLSLIAKVEEVDNIEVQMAKYFINNYSKSFGIAGIKKAEEYLASQEINKQSKKIISRAMPNISKVESVTLNTMIKRAKNWKQDSEFEEVFTKWMNQDDTRKNAFLASRYSNSSNIEKMILDTINMNKCTSIEIGTALITLAQWGTRRGLSDKFYTLIEKYKTDVTKNVYCDAAMCSIGKEKESLDLIREFLEQQYYESRQIFSIIRDCSYKSNQLLKKSVRKVYTEYLNSNDDDKIIKAINGAYELCDKPKFNFKNIVLPEIKRTLGIESDRVVQYSENVYLAVINLVERLLNDKNKDEFIDILFFIIDNDFCSTKLKLKSIAVLKRLKVDPPK